MIITADAIDGTIEKREEFAREEGRNEGREESARIIRQKDAEILDKNIQIAYLTDLLEKHGIQINN